MPDREASPMVFEPSARLQKYLGRELIADPNLAIIEFVKNSYDAGAANVRVEFFLDEDITSLEIADDGIGMDEESFRSNWLRPGFSEKSLEYLGPATTSVRNSSAVSRSQGREPAGEKGLGRLSAGRLGDKLEIWTRPDADAKWLHVEIDWASFDDMSLNLNEVQIPFDFSTQPPENMFESGTLVRIIGLRQRWTGRYPGRPAPGRRRTRLGRLRQDLEFLIRPLSNIDSNFTVELASDVVTERDDIGILSPRQARFESDYVYQFTVRPSTGSDAGNGAVIERSLSRSERISKEFSVARTETFPTAFRPSDDPQQPLKTGPFSGTFVYTPPPAARRAREIDAVGAGVLLYRDGVLGVRALVFRPNDREWEMSETRNSSDRAHPHRQDDPSCDTRDSSRGADGHGACRKNDCCSAHATARDSQTTRRRANLRARAKGSSCRTPG